jgi:TRAP-type transport system periplasmic protein
MKFKRNFMAIIVMCVVAIMVVGCSNDESSNGDSDNGSDEYVIKLGTVFGDSEPVNEYARKVAEAVSERTDGAVTIEVYPDSTLGSNVDTYEQIQAGAPVIGHGDPGYWQDWVPDIGVLQGPFLVNDPKDYDKILESDWYAGVSGQLADEGLTVLALNWVLGDRHVISNKEIRTPDDLDGMKFRIPPNVMWKETIAAMGGTPTELEWSEVYTGLSSGVVEAAEAPLSTIHGSSLHESADTISLTGHFKAISGFVIGTDYFNSLPEEYQQIMLEEFKKYGAEVTEAAYADQEEWIQTFESEGVNIVKDVDIEAFREATSVVYTKFDEWTPGLYEEIQSILSE